MSRIRTIKPEFWTSEQVVSCSPNARLMFIGLWNFCDDNGVHPASYMRLKAEVFPIDGFSLDDIKSWIDEGAKALAFNTYLTSLDARYNQMGDEGAKALALNTFLTSLNVSYNRIGDEGAKALALNTSLTSLDVSHNWIGDTGAKALALNTSLTSLNVSGNRIGDKMNLSKIIYCENILSRVNLIGL